MSTRQILCCWSLVLISAVLTIQRVGALELRMGMPLPPDSKEWSVASQGVTAISEATNGSVRVVLRHSEKDDESIAEQLKNRDLAGALITIQDVNMISLGQDFFAYAMPCTFRSKNEVAYVRSKLDTTLLENLSKGAYEAVAVVGFGSAYAMSSQALSSPDDWLARKLWVQDVFAKSLKTLGLQTISVPAKEVRNSLKRGDVDTVIVPPAVAVLKRWHTRMRTVFKSPFVYSYGVWVVRDDVLRELSVTEKDKLYEGLIALCQDLESTIQDRNEKAIDVMRRYGVEFVSPSDSMIEQWEHWSDTLRRSLDASYRPSVQIQNLLKEHLINYRQ